MREILLVHKRPGAQAEVLKTLPNLESLNKLLDGGYLCHIRMTPDIHGYVDDEGLLKELPLNFYLNGEPIVGPAIFSKIDGGGDERGFDSEEEATAFALFLNQGFPAIRAFNT